MPRGDGAGRALRAVPLFSSLSDRELRRVAELAREERFRAGEEIVTEGHSSGPFFLLTDGDAVVLVRGDEKRKLGPGDFFGEMALIDRQPRSATVRALGDVTALSISSWDFLTVLERNWPLAYGLMVELSRRVREQDAENPCL
jgi:CRP-like cAMP-binding protein